MFIAHRKYRLFERSALDRSQEIRKFLVGGQWVAFGYVRVMAARNVCTWAGGILAKHRAEASGTDECRVNAPMLLFTGIFA